MIQFEKSLKVNEIIKLGLLCTMFHFWILPCLSVHLFVVSTHPNMLCKHLPVVSKHFAISYLVSYGESVTYMNDGTSLKKVSYIYQWKSFKIKWVFCPYFFVSELMIKSCLRRDRKLLFWNFTIQCHIHANPVIPVVRYQGWGILP